LRTGFTQKKTKESNIEVRVNLDGQGISNINTTISFLNHIITTLATHSNVDIEVKANSDLKHHLSEDVALCLGEALNKALGDRKGITRFGWAIVPMDASLVTVALDLVRRPFTICSLSLNREAIEDMPCEDITHFISSLSQSMKSTIHIRTLYGGNDHHKVEAAFKALALSLKMAISIDPLRTGVASTKGVL
jgi:imidazoleglycerol-phosphate dehydratase